MTPMFEPLAQEEEPVALITVVETIGSSPSRPGAWMAVRKNGSVIGSIAGGCVEGAVYHSALDVLDNGDPRLEEYGPDGDIFRPGLTCGGRMVVSISVLDPAVAIAAQELSSLGTHFGIMTSLRGPERGTMKIILPSEDTIAGRLTAEDHTAVFDDFFLQSFRPPARMVLVGSTAYAEEMCALGHRLGYRVTVCDAREVFTTGERFPTAEVICDWPARWISAERDAGGFDSRTAFIVLTHDPKIDIPVLQELLSADRWVGQPAFIGALGSARSDRNRRIQLRENGITESELDHLYSPIGMPIGDNTPAETAVSIAAQLISVRASRTVGELNPVL